MGINVNKNGIINHKRDMVQKTSNKETKKKDRTYFDQSKGIK